MTQISTDITQDIFLNDANKLNYAINNILKKINTILICKIEVINQDKTFDVRSVLNVIGNDGTPYQPILQFSLDQMRIGGGNAGILVEPQVNDYVVVGYAQRDITNFKEIKNTTNPNTKRIFHHNDGIILGIYPTKEPSIIIKITNNEITINGNDKPINITNTNNINIKGNNVKIEANNTEIVANTIKLNGELEINNKKYLLHQHSGVQTGGATSGGVVDI